jgi:hypothetical protein
MGTAGATTSVGRSPRVSAVVGAGIIIIASKPLASLVDVGGFFAFHRSFVHSSVFTR